MKRWTEEAYWAMKCHLQKIEASNRRRKETAGWCLNYVILMICRLKMDLDTSRFSERQYQLLFYKELFPAYFSEVLYYRRLILIESEVNGLETSQCREYIKRQLEQINHYLEHHCNLWEYMNQGKKHLDDMLFTHAGMVIPVYPDSREYRGSNFFNFNSFIVSKIWAYTKVRSYLLHCFALTRTATSTEARSPASGSSEREIQNNDITMEKSDIDKKLNWLEGRLNVLSEQMYLGPLKERLHRRRSCAPAMELLLETVRGKKHK